MIGALTPRGYADDLQAAVIAAPEGKKTMLVTPITSMLRIMATIWARRVTRVIVVVEGHPAVAGFSRLGVMVAWPERLLG
jgi:hypothetical protein